MDNTCRCYSGRDTDGDGNCAFCANWTPEQVEAQKTMLFLSDSFFVLCDTMKAIDVQAERINDVRRNLLAKFPTLYIGRSK